MTSEQIREKFLEFFKKKGHAIIPSASLIPRFEDQSALFTTAGMHPLVPYFFGEDHPAGKRIANAQKCIRTGDIDDVGDNRHLTFFEMLGNWSFGDYFKKKAIEWSFEFLTGKEWLNLDPKRIYVTVFRGEQGIPADEEAIEIWKKVFKEKARMDVSIAGKDEMIKNNIRIIPLGAEDNFWIAGEIGPCGPDTEMFYDIKPERGPLEGNFFDLVKNFRLIEIWNDVFMEYEKRIKNQESEIKEYEYVKLAQKNVDTGMGLERTLAALNGKETVFESDLFEPIFAKIEQSSGKKYEDYKKEFRIIADHIKASAFIIADGVIPSNVQRGYVLRRLIRRAIRYAYRLGLKESGFSWAFAGEVIKMYQDFYPELKLKESNIREVLFEEEKKFGKTLERGLKEFEKAVSMARNKIDAFNLYQSYGFPIEMTKELAKERGLTVDEKSFNEELKKHQDISRAGAEKKFGGHGLVLGAGELKAENEEEMKKVIRFHTATHLLQWALREVLGNEAKQTGSDINSQRLRFDFFFNRKMMPEEIKKTEDLVNQKIKENLPVYFKEMPKKEAEKTGALSFFKAKYPEIVKVYFIGKENEAISKEFCNGPHVENTSEIGNLKIIKEESVSAGARRIRAVIE